MLKNSIPLYSSSRPYFGRVTNPSLIGKFSFAGDALKGGEILRRVYKNFSPFIGGVILCSTCMPEAS